MTGAGWAEAFLEMMAAERGAAANTLTAYGRDLEDASGYLARSGHDLAGATAEQIEGYFEDLGARGLSPATAARRRAAVRQFYRFVLGEGWRSDDPSRRVDAPKQGRPLPKILSRDETGRLIARINEQLLHGHFDLWTSDGSLVFRNNLLLTGGAEANDAQCETLIRLAVQTCQRYFPAVQFVVWAGRNAEDALESSLLETMGEA